MTPPNKIATPLPCTAAPSTPRSLKAAPPDWPVEKFFLTLGKPAALVKRFLDTLAKFPPLKPIMAFFSSVWVGISALFLIGVYVGIGSGFASLRAKLEMTDLQFFDAWPMQLLIAILAVTLTTVTLRRIPFTLYKAGVWTVHIGILTLLTGSVWYFSQKVEGSFRIYLNQTVNASYDVTERALYAYNMKSDGTPDLSSITMTPLPDLPIYYEHIPSRHNALNELLSPTTLATLQPALRDASLKIIGYYPYASLDKEWMPAENASAPPDGSHHHGVLLGFTANGSAGGQWFVADSPAGRVFDGPQMPFSVEYVYHPTPEQLADMQANLGGSAGLSVRIPKLHIDKTYTLTDATPFAVEDSPYTLTPGEQMGMPVISKGYENTFSNNLSVHVVRKDADGKETAFDRMVLARYPEISPDFITQPDGTRKRIQARVDNDIQIAFLDAQRDQLWLIEHGDEVNDPAKKFELLHRKAGGGDVEHAFINLQTPVDVKVGTVTMQFRFMGETDHAIEVAVPHIVPPEQRQRGQTAMDAMQFSVVELAFSRGNNHADHIYVPFVQFAQIGEPPGGRPPTVINIPGVGQVGLTLSTTRHELPTSVKLVSFQAVKYPGAASGARSYENYISTLELTDRATEKKETVIAQLNDPAANHGLYYFQSGWDGDDNAPPDKRFSILGVGNRPGLTTMIVGALLIVLGIGYAFYVKPILLQKKKKSLAAWAQKNS